MKLYFHYPKPPLGAVVKSILLYEGYTGANAYEILLPDGVPQLIIALDSQPRYARMGEQGTDDFRALGKSWVNGLLTQPLVYQSEQNATVMAIQFAPQGLAQLLKLPASELVDKVYGAEEVGHKTILSWREKIMEQGTAAGKFAMAEAYLGDNLVKSPNHDPMVAHMVNSPRFASTTVKAISEQARCSQRHLIGQFRQTIGVTPKKLQTILKVNRAIAMLNAKPRFDMAQVALSCGFYDQSHFIKNFKQLVSITPQAYLKANRAYPHVLVRD